jgi:hypothetical protein
MNAIDGQSPNEQMIQSQQISGAIHSYNYDKVKKTLCLTFNDGYVYQYFGVPEQILTGLLNSEQPRSFYLNYIRNRYRRLLKTYNLEVLK